MKGSVIAANRRTAQPQYDHNLNDGAPSKLSSLRITFNGPGNIILCEIIRKKSKFTFHFVNASSRPLSLEAFSSVFTRRVELPVDSLSHVTCHIQHISFQLLSRESQSCHAADAAVHCLVTGFQPGQLSVTAPSRPSLEAVIFHVLALFSASCIH